MALSQADNAYLPNKLFPDKQFIVAKGTNPNYLIHITDVNSGFELVADMPEQVSFSLSSEWEAKLPSSSSGMIGGNVTGALSGSDTVIQQLTWQVWSGTTPVEIPITILFDAERSAFSEVYTPIRLLETLVLPELIGKAFMRAPGPTPLNPTGGFNVKIGRMLSLYNCLMTSVSSTYDTRLDKDGYPISGQAEINIRTNRIYGRKEWLEAANLSRSSLAR